MVKILYSFNKRGFEAEYWEREIAQASNDQAQFIPFNHDPYLDPNQYVRAQLLDDLYYARHPGLLRLYADFEAALRKHQADAVIVDNCPPYHPDYLRKLPLYKALRIADGPISAYDRDFAYLHAYHLILYHSPAYSADMGMAEKLRYCGATNICFWPMGVFDAMCDPRQTEETILAGERGIDIAFIGRVHAGKRPLLARVKKAFGPRLRLHGLLGWKGNLDFNLRYGFPGWVRPVAGQSYVPLYQRAKIGFNVHNRGDYTVGSYRLFELPANGVMQISDGGEYLDQFFRVGEEIVRYSGADDLIDLLRYYLDHDAERQRIALNGYRRVMRDHRIGHRLRQVAELICQAVQRGAPR
jgi:glycosyltransferase involved in cell wall biosynthesis